MLAKLHNVGHLDLRHATAHRLVNAYPKMTGIGLRQRNGRPVVVAVFVFAGNLAVSATIAFCWINYEYFAHASFLPR